MKIALIVVGSIAIIVALTMGGFGIRYLLAPVRGAVDAREQIQSAPNRIVQYNHFFDLCASIQGNEDAIVAQRAQLATAETVENRARINANIAGITAARARNIADYNADAAKSYTDGQFRDSNLPYQINKGGESTRCVN